MRRKLITLLCILVVLTACDDEDTGPQFTGVTADGEIISPVGLVDLDRIDAAFEPYLATFLLQAEQLNTPIEISRLERLSISFVDSLEGALGQCTTGQAEVVISRVAWEELGRAFVSGLEIDGDDARQRLIYHELGHCLLSRPHVNNFTPSGDWASIMRGDPFEDGNQPSMDYRFNKQLYYNRELFEPGTFIPAFFTDTSSFTALTQGFVATDSTEGLPAFSTGAANGLPAVLFSSDVPAEDYHYRIRFFVEEDRTQTIATVLALGARRGLGGRLDLSHSISVYLEEGLYGINANDYGFLLLQEEETYTPFESQVVDLVRKADLYFFYLNGRLLLKTQDPTFAFEDVIIIPNRQGQRFVVEEQKLFRAPDTTMVAQQKSLRVTSTSSQVLSQAVAPLPNRIEPSVHLQLEQHRHRHDQL